MKKRDTTNHFASPGNALIEQVLIFKKQMFLLGNKLLSVTSWRPRSVELSERYAVTSFFVRQWLKDACKWRVFIFRCPNTRGSLKPALAHGIAAKSRRDADRTLLVRRAGQPRVTLLHSQARMHHRRMHWCITKRLLLSVAAIRRNIPSYQRHCKKSRRVSPAHALCTRCYCEYHISR